MWQEELEHKLGIKSDLKAFVLHAPSNYLDLLPSTQLVNNIDNLSGELDWLQAFYLNKELLDSEITLLVNKLSKSGQLWLSWPKKSSGIQTDLSDKIIRSAGLESGLVDVKVVAISPIWSGLKFVYRLNISKTPAK